VISLFVYILKQIGHVAVDFRRVWLETNVAQRPFSAKIKTGYRLTIDSANHQQHSLAKHVNGHLSNLVEHLRMQQQFPAVQDVPVLVVARQGLDQHQILGIVYTRASPNVQVFRPIFGTCGGKCVVDELALFVQSTSLLKKRRSLKDAVPGYF